MRLGVISDVHANRHALEAALETLEREGVDRYVCAGDLVGYGPYPNECVERLAEKDALCVAGNHDLIACGRLSDRGIGALAKTTLDWTSDRLDDSSQAFLAALPTTATLGPLVVAHGALGDPSAYVTRREHAVEQLDRLARDHPSATLLLLGHPHRCFAYGELRRDVLCGGSGSVALDGVERFLLNPGSVGQARERAPVVRFMVLDLVRRRAEFRGVRYEHASCRAALRERGLPPGACHVKPSTRVTFARALGRARRRIGPSRGHPPQ